MTRVCLIGFTLAPDLSNQLEDITGLSIQHISSSGPNSKVFNSIWNPSLSLWEDNLFNEDEFRFILNYYSEIIESLSRPHRLEPLKRLAVQDYHLLLKQVYLAVKLHLFRTNPHLVIFGDIPHDGPDLVIAALCGFHKIPCYAAWQLPFSPCFNILPLRIDNSGIYWRFSNRRKTKVPELEHNVLESIRIYCDQVYRCGGYSYMQDLKIRGFPRLLDATKGRGFGKVLYRFVWYAMIQLKQFRYVKTIESLSRGFDPDKVKPYIYFPLHMQPEMTSSALGGRIYNDQALLLNQLAALCSMHGINVVVKENPKQSFSHRSTLMFQNIEESKSIIFAPTSHSTDSLVRNSICVATVSGTVGIEAIARQKHVFVAGTAWYEDHPQVISDLADLRKFILQCKKGSAIPQRVDLESFLKEIAASSWSGCSDSRYCENYQMTPRDNQGLLVKSLSTFIPSIVLAPRNEPTHKTTN